jgi:signal transduction histidine kinase
MWPRGCASPSGGWRPGQERRRAEHELQKSKYLAGIGEVSLALQHEINNPLAALLTNSSLISSGMLDASEVKESLETIDVQARRIADVVKRLSALETPRSVEYIQGQRMVDLRDGPGKPKP